VGKPDQSQILIRFALLETTGHESGVLTTAPSTFEKATSKIEKLQGTSDVTFINELLNVVLPS
jgi:hypothetical protein